VFVDLQEDYVVSLTARIIQVLGNIGFLTSNESTARHERGRFLDFALNLFASQHIAIQRSLAMALAQLWERVDTQLLFLEVLPHAEQIAAWVQTLINCPDEQTRQLAARIATKLEAGLSSTY
jgi:hypothetical protein